MEDTSFNGGLIAWLMGLPFIIFIILSEKKNSIEKLVYNNQSYKDGEKI